MGLAILDEILDDEESLTLALGILKSNTTSDLEKFFKACVTLLIAEIEDRLAAFATPPAPASEPAPAADTGLTALKTT